MSCNQDPHDRFHLPMTYTLVEPTAGATSGLTLVVSNYPETIAAGEALPETLYKCSIPISTSSKRIRLFAWHLNSKGASINIGAVVSVDAAGETATISNIKKQKTPPPSSGFGAQGICCANAQLYGTLDIELGTVAVTAAESVFRTYAVANGDLLGIVVEFDIVASTSCNLRLRTVAYQGGGVPGSWADSPPKPPGNPPVYPHPRGSWPHSALLVNCGSFDVTPNLGPNDKKILCCKKMGFEENQFPADDEFSSRLRGLFGANLTYRCTISSAADGGTLWVYVVALDTRAQSALSAPPYFGAASIAAWEDREDRYIPAIQWANPDDPNDNHLNIVDLTYAGPLTVSQGEEKVLDVLVANAGSATMPFMLLLSKINLHIQP